MASRGLVLLLLAALCGLASAYVFDDRIAARTACYKACMTSDGYDPVCVINPEYPKPILRFPYGGGMDVWPNECSAQCMVDYCRYGPWCNLKTQYRVKLPKTCYKHAWEIFLHLTKDAPECNAEKACKKANKVDKKPEYKPLSKADCMKACVDRDGWKPVCVKEFRSKQKMAFGNGCAAACALVSPTPLYDVKLPKPCKTEFMKTGKFSAKCGKCPKGKEDPDLVIKSDREVARQFCYKHCISRSHWEPVCSWNPAYPNKTSHGGGDSVWPNACTAQCMAKYCEYGEWCHLETKYEISLPKKCEKDMWKIYYIGPDAPSAPESVIKKCTTCPPPK